MAKVSKAPVRKKRPGKFKIMFMVCCALGVLLAALPSVVVIIVGMVPTLVAYIIDLTPGRYAARCVFGLNIAGTVPYLEKLWSSTNDMPAAVAIVTDVYTWLVFYLAAGVGWMLFLGLPGLVTQFKTYAAKRKAQTLRDRLEELRKEWGKEVTGASSDDEDEEDEETKDALDNRADEPAPASMTPARQGAA